MRLVLEEGLVEVAVDLAARYFGECSPKFKEIYSMFLEKLRRGEPVSDVRLGKLAKDFCLRDEHLRAMAAEVSELLRRHGYLPEAPPAEEEFKRSRGPRGSYVSLLSLLATVLIRSGCAADRPPAVLAGEAYMALALGNFRRAAAALLAAVAALNGKRRVAERVVRLGFSQSLEKLLDFNCRSAKVAEALEAQGLFITSEEILRLRRA